MNIREKVEEVLEHFDYAIVSTSKIEHNNVVHVPNTVPSQLKRFLYIVFGERVSKVKGGFKITNAKG